MKPSSRSLVAPLVGLGVLALVLNVTLAAVRTTGAWKRARGTTAATGQNPYSALDQQLARRGASAVPAIRSPFAFGGIAVAALPVERPRRPVVPPPPPVPVLTAIVWDADPRATIRYNGRDYSVRTSALFDEFRVVSISRDQVVLDRGGESLVLRLPTGER